MTEYRTGELDALVTAYVERKWSALAGQHANSGPELVQLLVHALFRSSALGAEAWNESLENLHWFLSRAAKRFLSNKPDNNAYKHGLRLFTHGQWGIIAHPDGHPEQASKVLEHECGLTYLVAEGPPTARKVMRLTKAFNWELSLNCLFVMRQILVTIQKCRLARLEERPGVEDMPTFLTIDRQGFVDNEPVGQFSISA